MKQRILLLSLGAIAALGVAAFAQSSPASDDRAADREAIRSHIDSIFQASIRKDREKVRATHSEDWRGFLIRVRALVGRT